MEQRRVWTARLSIRCVLALLVTLLPTTASHAAYTYTPQGPLKVPRINQDDEDEDGRCFLLSIATVQAFLLKKYTYGGKTQSYTYGTHYSFRNGDPCYKMALAANNKHGGGGSGSGYIMFGMFNDLAVPMTRVEVTQSQMLTLAYQCLAQGKPCVLYTGKHASVIMSYNGNSNTLSAKDFAIMEIKKFEYSVNKKYDLWHDSPSDFNAYAAKPAGSNLGSTRHCYLRLDAWQAWNGTSISSFAYPKSVNISSMPGSFSSLSASEVTTCNDAAVTPKTAYEYKVHAYRYDNGSKSNRYGDYSAVCAVTALEATPPEPQDPYFHTMAVSGVTTTDAVITSTFPQQNIVACGFELGLTESSMTRYADTFDAVALAKIDFRLSQCREALTPGTTYCYRLWYQVEDEAEHRSELFTFVTLPDVPTITSATSPATAKTTVTWQPVPGATKYAVFRATAGQTDYVKVGMPEGVATYTDSVTGGRGYDYIVQACAADTPNNANRWGGFSSKMTVKAAGAYTSPDTSDKVFKSVTVTGVTSTEAVVDCHIDGTNLNYAGVKVGTSATSLKNISEACGGVYVEYIKYGMNKWYGTLAAGTTYYYQFWYTNIAGTTKTGALRSFCTVPAAPTVTATAAANGVSLSWSTMKGASFYEVYRSTDASTYTKIATLKSIEDRKCFDAAAVAGATNTYRVRVGLYDVGCNVKRYSGYGTAAVKLDGRSPDTVTAEAIGGLQSGVLVRLSFSGTATPCALYRVSRGEAPELLCSDVTDTYLDTTAVPGTTYQYLAAYSETATLRTASNLVTLAPISATSVIVTPQDITTYPNHVIKLDVKPVPANATIMDFSITPSDPTVAVIGYDETGYFLSACTCGSTDIVCTLSGQQIVGGHVTVKPYSRFLRLPASLTAVSRKAYAGDTTLECVVFPRGQSVTIGDEAFRGCSGLAKVELGSNVTTIGANAFADCPNLMAYCPEGSYAMQYCKANNIPVLAIIE